MTGIHRQRSTIPVLAALLFLAVGQAFSQQGEYVIGKGDQLLITVWGFPEFSTTATVRDDGALTLPLAGDIQAAGLGRESFAAALKRRLADFIQGDIRVTVSVLSASAQRVAVLGAVHRPDTYPVTGETGLLELLGTAGGTTPEANLGRIQIFRKDRARENAVIDLEQSIERADVDRLPMVQPGDVVFVPREKNFLKEFGEYAGYVALFSALLLLTEGGGR